MWRHHDGINVCWQAPSQVERWKVAGRVQGSLPCGTHDYWPSTCHPQSRRDIYYIWSCRVGWLKRKPPTDTPATTPPPPAPTTPPHLFSRVMIGPRPNYRPVGAHTLRFLFGNNSKRHTLHFYILEKFISPCLLWDERVRPLSGLPIYPSGWVFMPSFLVMGKRGKTCIPTAGMAYSCICNLLWNESDMETRKGFHFTDKNYPGRWVEQTANLVNVLAVLKPNATPTDTKASKGFF